MSYRYVPLSDQVLERVRTRIRTHVLVWTVRDMQREDAHCGIRTQAVSDCILEAWREAERQDEALVLEAGSLWGFVDQAQAQTLWTYITGTVPNPDRRLSSDQRFIVRRSLERLLGDLSTLAVHVSRATADVELAHKRGSGWSLHRIEVDELSFHVLLPPEVALDWMGRPAASISHIVSRLVPLREAIRPAQLTLSAELGKVSIRLEDLRQLAVGDVLTLDRRLTDSLQVVTQSGEYVLDARLGCLSGSKALVATGIK